MAGKLRSLVVCTHHLGSGLRSAGNARLTQLFLFVFFEGGGRVLKFIQMGVFPFCLLSLNGATHYKLSYA